MRRRCSSQPDPCCHVAQLWKAEEKAAAEQRQLEELRKQYAAEREAEELREVAIAGGHLKCATEHFAFQHKAITVMVRAIAVTMNVLSVSS